MEQIKDIKKSVMWLTKPRIVFYTMIWLMVLLFVGTIAQKYIGLYRAQNMFFSSWIVWWGPVPFPGGLLTLGLLTLSLTAKLFLASRWSWQNSGTIVTHIGALLLLVGGLITYMHAQEGSMIIYEGERSHVFSDYHIRELIVEDSENKRQIIAFPWDDLEAGKVFDIPNLPVRIEIVKLCKNCNIFPRKKVEDDPVFSELRGMAQRMDIALLPPEKEDEQNRGAVQFRISGAGEEKDGIHFSTDFIDVSPWIKVDNKVYNIALRRKQTVLPFEIELIDFEKQLYPGTDKPKSYKSEIILRENGSEWRSIIQMNEPLRYRGYTFYQSSFIEGDEQEATILAVVKNAGRMFPYIASIVMCIGLLIHVILRLPKLIGTALAGKTTKAAKVALFAGVLIMSAGFAPQARATSYDYNFEVFSRIPILDQGRVKPLDTFARTYLEIISGRDSLSDMEAIEWLAEVILDPGRAYKREIFNIPNPKVVDALALERRKGHRYSYKEVTTAFYTHSKTWDFLFTMPEEEMSLPQKQLLEAFTKTQLFAELSRSLSLVFPDFLIPEGPLSKALDVDPGTSVNFIKLRNQQTLIEQMSKDLLKKSKNKDYKISAEGVMLTSIAAHMAALNRDRNSYILKVIPPQWESVSENNHDRMWFSPWGIGVYGQGSPDSVKFLNMWGELVQAYRMGNNTKWNDLTAELRAFSLSMADQKALNGVLSLEVFFNNAKPFSISFIFYLSAFLVVMASFMIWPERLRRLAFGMVLAGFAFHATGLGVRMFIMQRPPVTNLYESVIFVSLIACLFGLFLEWRLKNTIGIIIAASMGTILHFMGMKFDAEGDTMGMLVAVLDTNFWLATHVVTITIGYGCCLVGGVLGHIYLIQRLVKPGDTKRLSDLFRNMRGVVFVALLFAVIGTILGGIWADQSWGRFWGWDPKENGALLIVLWLIFLIHGRLSGIVGELGFAAGMVCTNIIVAMAWFGVNLLSVGLHSYGFTESAAVSFFVFCGFEFLFAVGAYTFIRLQKNKQGLKI